MAKDFINAAKRTCVTAHEALPSTYAKFSKSRSIPSKLFVATKSVIVLTKTSRLAESAIRLERTIVAVLPVLGSLDAVESVIVGIILYPAERNLVSVSAIGLFGLAGVYKSVIFVALSSEYQNGITS